MIAKKAGLVYRAVIDRLKKGVFLLQYGDIKQAYETIVPSGQNDFPGWVKGERSNFIIVLSILPDLSILS